MFSYRRRQNVKPNGLSGSPWLIGIWRFRPLVRMVDRCAAPLTTASPSASANARATLVITPYWYHTHPPGRLSESGHEIPLAADPFRAIGGEPPASREDRRGIKVRLGDDVWLEPAGEPLIIPVRGHRVLIGKRPDVPKRPDAPRAGADDDQIVAGVRRQHGVTIRLGLAIEQLLADRGNHLDVD